MTEIERTLEEERRIINAATNGPWEWRDDQYPGQLIRRVYLGDPTSEDWMKRGEVHPMNVLKCGGWLPTDGDAHFIAHARTALPLRNAQVAAALRVLDDYAPPSKEDDPTGTVLAHMERLEQAVRAALDTVRAIEGAGA